MGDWDAFTENLVQELRTHTTVHEIATINATSVVHDATGNLTRNAGDTLDCYTWDFDNRLALADVDQDGNAECGYQYDALGRRVSKTVPDGEGSATTVFIGTIQALEHSPHAMQVVAEYMADAAPNSTARKFVYATYIDEPVMMVSVNGATTTPYYYHQNSLYSVAALTDATGTVVERYAYSAYGKPLFLDANGNLLDPQASTVGNPYLFTGRRLDEETGLYYYRARMYDPELGRFLGRDPIGYEAGPNVYAYITNSPLSHVDPIGHQRVLPQEHKVEPRHCEIVIIMGHTINLPAPRRKAFVQIWMEKYLDAYTKWEAAPKCASLHAFSCLSEHLDEKWLPGPPIDVPSDVELPGWPKFSGLVPKATAMAPLVKGLSDILKQAKYQGWCGEPCCCDSIDIKTVCQPDIAYWAQTSGASHAIPFSGGKTIADICGVDKARPPRRNRDGSWPNRPLYVGGM